MNILESALKSFSLKRQMPVNIHFATFYRTGKPWYEVITVNYSSLHQHCLKKRKRSNVVTSSPPVSFSIKNYMEVFLVWVSFALTCVMHWLLTSFLGSS